jgi:hypothetical protein
MHGPIQQGLSLDVLMGMLQVRHLPHDPSEEVFLILAFLIVGGGPRTPYQGVEEFVQLARSDVAEVGEVD